MRRCAYSHLVTSTGQTLAFQAFQELTWMAKILKMWLELLFNLQQV